MPLSQFRLETALKMHANAERRAQRREEARPLARVAGGIGGALRQAGLRLSFQLGRGLEAVGQGVGRLRSPRPKALEGGSEPAEFLVVGHRGSPRRRVENTIESVAWAVEQDGANAVEIDLSMTRDGHVVLWHDWDPNDIVALARQLGLEGLKFRPEAPALWDDHRRLTHELTLAELREHFGYKKRTFLFFHRRVKAHIPTFDEFVAWAKEQPALRCVILDIKLPEDHIDLVPDFVRGLRRSLGAHEAPQRFVCMTPKVPVLEAMKAIAPDLDYTFDVEVPPGVGQDAEDYSATAQAIRFGNRFASIGRPTLTLGAWSLYQDILTRDLEKQAEHNASGAEPPVEGFIGWTINKPGEARRMIEMGVQGILTDKPRQLHRLARRLGR